MTDDLIGELRAKLSQLESELTQKRAQRDQLEDEIQKAEGLMRAYETVIFSEGGTVPASSMVELPIEVVGPAGPPPRAQMSIPEAVTAVLVERNRAMHADEILKELRFRGMPLSAADPKASVVTALVRGAKKGKYVKVGPNTYRLATVRT